MRATPLARLTLLLLPALPVMPLAAQEPVPADTTVLRPDTASTEDVHPQDIQDDRGYTILTDRGRARLRLYGSVRLAGFYDLGGLSGQSDFSTYDIVVGETGLDPRFAMDATQTRFGFEGNRDSTPFGPLLFRIEMDFRGGEEDGSLRLRHAYARAGPFLAGQTWSTFAHVSTLPVTVDVEGPPSSVNLRSPQVRYTFSHQDGRETAVAIESPQADLPELADTLDATYQSVPDIVVHWRRTGETREFQVAGVLRGIEYSQQDEIKNTMGIGAAVSGRTSFGPLSELVFQVVGGTGISRYVSGLNGRGLDLGIDRTNGNIGPIPVLGWVVSAGHAWSASSRSYVVVGGNRLWQPAGTPDDAYRSSTYVAANYFYEPMPGMQVAGEVTVGRRVNIDLESGRAVRFGFLARYDF